MRPHSASCALVVASLVNRLRSALDPQRSTAHDIDTDRNHYDRHPVDDRWPFTENWNGHECRHRWAQRRESCPARRAEDANGTSVEHIRDDRGE